MGEELREEFFFFMYHMQIPEENVLDMTPENRKWYIQRFVEQKKREHSEMEKAKNKAKAQGNR